MAKVNFASGDMRTFCVAGANENLVTSLAYEAMAMDQALLKFVPIDQL